MSFSSIPYSDDRFYAKYWIETAYPLLQAAEMMAGEQSTGTFLRVPGETEELREVYGARVERITELGKNELPSLPDAGLPKNWDGIRRTAEVLLSWPVHNIGPSLPNLLATCCRKSLRAEGYSQGLGLWILFSRQPFCPLIKVPSLELGGLDKLQMFLEGRL